MWGRRGRAEGGGTAPGPVGPTAVTAARPASPTAEAALDMAVLAQAIASDEPEALLRMLVMFREAFLDLEAQIDQSVTARDQKALRESAHAAAGAAANVGAQPLSVVLRELELSAAGGGDKKISCMHIRGHE